MKYYLNKEHSVTKNNIKLYASQSKTDSFNELLLQKLRISDHCNV